MRKNYAKRVELLAEVITIRLNNRALEHVTMLVNHGNFDETIFRAAFSVDNNLHHFVDNDYWPEYVKSCIVSEIVRAMEHGLWRPENADEILRSLGQC